MPSNKKAQDEQWRKRANEACSDSYYRYHASNKEKARLRMSKLRAERQIEGVLPTAAQCESTRATNRKAAARYRARNLEIIRAKAAQYMRERRALRKLEYGEHQGIQQNLADSNVEMAEGPEKENETDTGEDFYSYTPRRLFLSPHRPLLSPRHPLHSPCHPIHSPHRSLHSPHCTPRRRRVPLIAHQIGVDDDTNLRSPHRTPRRHLPSRAHKIGLDDSIDPRLKDTMLSDSEYDGDLDIAADEYGLWEDFYLSSEEVYTDYV